jgi:CDP-paratose 2-epimerase
MGGGRANSISILETIEALRGLGYPLDYRYDDQARTGDHICYISDLTKIRTHFPGWNLTYRLPRILDDIVQHYVNLCPV